MPTAKPSCKLLPSGSQAAGLYAIQLDLEYRSVRESKVRIGGFGRAVSISNAEIVFQAEAGLPPGIALELRLEWPAKLNPATGMALVIRGRTTSASGSHSAVRILRSEFRARALQMAGAAVCPAS